MGPKNFQLPRSLKKGLVGLVLLLVAFGGIMFYKASQFHIVRTDPKLSAIADTAPSLTVYFNDEIQSADFSPTYDPSIVSSSDIGKKSVTFHFTNNLKVGKQYTIIINYVRNKSGDVLTDKKLVFTVRDIEFNKLSKKQQKALINAQDQRVYDVNGITYTNFDTLLSYGISSEQLENIKSLLFDYSNTVGKRFWQMTLQKDSVVITNHNPETGETTDKLDFIVSLGGSDFRAHAEYDVLSDGIHLLLTDTAGNLVYDSANTQN